MHLHFLRSQTFRKDIHRFGWNAVVEQLKNKFHNSSSNVAFDDFIEFTFHAPPGQYKEILPYSFDWVGVLHHPSNVTFPFDVKFGAPALFASEIFRQSLKTCKCLITLSSTLKRDAEILLARTYTPNLPVESLLYPTNLNVEQFTFDKYKAQKKVIQLGWWLRKFESLYKLKTNIPKFFLLGNSEWASAQHILCDKLYEEKKQLRINLPPRDATVLPFIEPSKYDSLLASSVVFLDLIDTSANSAVIECIASGTPILVNPHEAVVEYLGADYPLYWDSLEEAALKLQSDKLIQETSEYLKKNEMRFKISYSYFINQFENKLKKYL